MVAVAEETADKLEEDNVSVEVIDLRLCHHGMKRQF